MKKRKFKKFLAFIKVECETHGVTLDFVDSDYVESEDGIKYGGYFDAENKVLVCTINHKESETLLIHEYAHMTQWLDKIPLWTLATDSLEVLDDWLNGVDVLNIESHIKNIRDLELDNEKRTVELMIKWELGVNIDSYIKKSNAYIMFYNYLLISREWPQPENSPHSNKKIIKKMSNKFDMDYENMSPKLLKLFKR
jgi:hypothetical protein